jgi:8-oxo-dGTP pyrophosphatase MutT (NUDIX family)
MNRNQPAPRQQIEKYSVPQLQALIQAYTKDKIHDPFPRQLLTGQPRSASILIPFVWEQEGWHILFIRRTQIDGDMHSGQVAFPGGASDPGDYNPVATALREAEEEIGISSNQVAILGTLGQMRTISNYIITPVIGILDWPVALRPAPSEVSRIFTIPLAWLADPSNRIINQRKLPTTGESLPVIHYQEYDGEILWGASARIMMELLEALQSK